MLREVLEGECVRGGVLEGDDELMIEGMMLVGMLDGKEC